MNTLELQQVLMNNQSTQLQTGSVCAMDQLPNTVQQRPKLYIVNSQESHRQGQHWLALYFPKVGPAECFDSLGHTPQYYHWRLARFLKTQGGYYICNRRRVQQPGTKTCGQFCVYYLQHRCNGRTMHQILGDFDETNLDYNENLVTRMDDLDLTCI